MGDYIVLVCYKNTLSVLRNETFLGQTLDYVKGTVKYNPTTEDIYIYQVRLGNPVFKTGIF